MIQREMRNQYEYELGLLTGMNEAIMNQNDQMRDRILQQNAKIQEVRISMVKFFKSHWPSSSIAPPIKKLYSDFKILIFKP